MLLRENVAFTYLSCELLCYMRHVLRINSALVQSLLLQAGVLFVINISFK